MSDKAITVTVWEPTDQQLQVARYIAAGYTQQRAADAVGVGLRTVGRWMAETPLPDLVADIREEIRDTQEPQFQKTIDLAQQIVIGALSGEYRADDPRVLLAERVLARTLHRIIAMEARGSGRNVPEEPASIRNQLPYNPKEPAA